MTTDTKAEILAAERRFWDAIQRKDGEEAARMTAERCIITGAQGVSGIDREMMKTLTVEGDWTIESYEFDDGSIQVQEIGDEVVVVAYKVTEHIRVGGEPITLVANDSSVWHRERDDWLCVMHTESPAGDPFGRSSK